MRRTRSGCVAPPMAVPTLLLLLPIPFLFPVIVVLPVATLVVVIIVVVVTVVFACVARARTFQGGFCPSRRREQRIFCVLTPPTRACEHCEIPECGGGVGAGSEIINIVCG